MLAGDNLSNDILQSHYTLGIRNRVFLSQNVVNSSNHGNVLPSLVVELTYLVKNGIILLFNHVTDLLNHNELCDSSLEPIVNLPCSFQI